jgi:hypothetical protein
MAKIILYCAASVLALTGCATEERHRQVADVARAQTLVEQAEQGGAQQYAAADLEAARNKLQVAQNKKTDDEVAQRLAVESAADAEVAVARTRAAKAQQAVTQVNAGHETLRQEATVEQSATSPSSTMPPSPPPGALPSTTPPIGDQPQPPPR